MTDENDVTCLKEEICEVLAELDKNVKYLEDVPEVASMLYSIKGKLENKLEEIKRLNARFEQNVFDPEVMQHDEKNGYTAIMNPIQESNQVEIF